jgi:hypothetical protein
MLDFPSPSQPANSNHDDLANDCINKILTAGSLEKSGDVAAAIALYQEVLELDPKGNYGAVAQKAIESLAGQLESEDNSSIQSVAIPETQPKITSLAQRWLRRFWGRWGLARI